MTRGHFVTLEGIEGVGKTTALACVSETLRSRDLAVIETREPGGTSLGEKMRSLVLAPDESLIAPMTELLVMFASRAQHLHEVIKPALEAGKSVVCDRFTDATFAYQGGGRGIDMAMIRTLEALVHADLQPSLTLLLDASPEIGLARARRRGERDRFESEQVAFFKRVRASYLERAGMYPQRFVVIDAAQPIAMVHAAIQSALDKRLP